MEGKKLYTPLMAANEVGVTKDYIHKAIKRGQLKFTQVGDKGGPIFIEEDDLRSWDALRKRRNRKLST